MLGPTPFYRLKNHRLKFSIWKVVHLILLILFCWCNLKNRFVSAQQGELPGWRKRNSAEISQQCHRAVWWQAGRILDHCLQEWWCHGTGSGQNWTTASRPNHGLGRHWQKRAKRCKRCWSLERHYGICSWKIWFCHINRFLTLDWQLTTHLQLTGSIATFPTYTFQTHALKMKIASKLITTFNMFDQNIFIFHKWTFLGTYPTQSVGTDRWLLASTLALGHHLLASGSPETPS